MKSLFKSVLTATLCSVVVFSCGNPAKMAKEAEKLQAKCEPQPLEVVAGKINAKVSLTFPADYFHPKAVVEAIPVLVYQGGEQALDPIMLQGEDIAGNYQVVPKTGASVEKNLTFDYVEGVEKSSLEFRVTVLNKEERIAFPAPIKVADGANTTYQLVKPNEALAFAPDAYQAIIPETEEAQILYLINSSNVRSSQLKSSEIKAFQDFLANVKADERREVKNTEIVAYASPDGKESYNAKLSADRAKSASQAFNKTINKAKIEASVDSRSIDEDWEGFQELVKNSNIADKDLILRVLEMYSDPAVRESEIKNMSAVYTTLKKDILPQLRRARFIANVEFTNYTDAELLALVQSNIEVLDEEALLHVATLIDKCENKLDIYEKAIDKYSSDRAKVNAAVLKVKAGDLAAAKSYLAQVSNKEDYYYNTTAVIALCENNVAAAKIALKNSSIKEAKYNAGVVDILEGKYAEAKSKLAGEGGFNEALSCILTNDLAGASSILKDANCPCKSYLKAIIAARQGKTDDAKAAIAVASKNEKLAKRAANDIEFAKL
ncbi:MAG: hypothetical protein HUJ89_01930 [Bacteroidales bacterium]|nr:hypothetical protein [Bacteroidales bacterium]